MPWPAPESGPPGRAVGEQNRIGSLDGLRGVAALVVVLHHSLLAAPSLADPYRNITRVPVWSRSWWAVYTPLHLAWGGGEAVYVFFVLSGFVLARPYIGVAQAQWTPYYAKRAVRLYLPTFGALALAAAVRWSVRRRTFPGASWWLLARQVPVTSRGVINDALLVFAPGTLTGVLWTLRWEVLFSMLLPMFVASAQLLLRRSGTAVGVGLALLMLGSRWIVLPSDLFFLPLFGFGVLLASRERLVREVLTRLMASPAVKFGVGALALLVASGHWVIGWSVSRWSPYLRSRLGDLADVTTALGCVAIVALVLAGGPLSGVLVRQPCRWLGSRSFSLYLTHEPIVISCAYLAHGFTVLSASVGVVASLAAAEVLFRLVERPAVALSRRAGVATRARLVGQDFAERSG